MAFPTTSEILYKANSIINNPQAFQAHMWKTQPCKFGNNCSHQVSECPGAHFLEEYRVPVCLYLHACKTPMQCKMYHPHLGTADQFISFLGMNKILPTKSEWEMNKQRRDFVLSGAKITIDNPELLRKHLFKTRPCFNGVQCKDKEKCPGAHYIEEYRLPICLYMEFCQEKRCTNFHPHHGKTSQQYMDEHNINLPSKDLFISEPYNFEENTRPLNTPNKKAAPQLFENKKANTAFCSFVKENKKCTKNSCPFAHSVEDFRLNDGKDYSDMNEKKIAIEKRIGFVPDYFMKPSYKNSVYISLMREQVKLVDYLKEDNEDHHHKDDEDDEDESNIQEIIDIIDKEREIEENKEYFLLELELLDYAKDEIEDQEDEEDDILSDIRVKISINSITSMLKWENMKKERSEELWGDMSDSE